MVVDPGLTGMLRGSARVVGCWRACRYLRWVVGRGSVVAVDLGREVGMARAREVVGCCRLRCVGMVAGQGVDHV